MRIAVFGATGRTGVPLVEQALDRGHEVVAFVRTPERLPVVDDALHVVDAMRANGPGFTAIAWAEVARFMLDCPEADENVRTMPTVGPA
jgi:uncharacterized protein YbjT (DUF2867 family)